MLRSDPGERAPVKFLLGGWDQRTAAQRPLSDTVTLSRSSDTMSRRTEQSRIRGWGGVRPGEPVEADGHFAPCTASPPHWKVGIISSV